MYQRENLVVLVYADNTCYTKVVTLVEAEQELGSKYSKLKIDLAGGTWQREYDYKTVTQTIGQSFSMRREHRWGVIGVYDKTEIDQINAMVHASQEATKSQGDCLED